MLIKIHNDELVEFPDALAAQILATPIVAKTVPDYSIEEVNAVIHGILGALFEDELTLEQNIQAVRAIYDAQGPASAANLAKATGLIRNYNENIAVEDIAWVSADLAFPFGGNNYQSKNDCVNDHAPALGTDTAAPVAFQKGEKLARIEK
jgi:hypothetical protein